MIILQYKGRMVKCDTAAEAAELLKLLDSEERPSVIESFLGGTIFTARSAWSRKSFGEFTESLGENQNHVLRLLVAKQRMTDQELRNALDLDSNKALAGVLSGISKQAGALNVPARAVYTVEDERKGGELRKTYAIAGDFLQMAKEMNWTGD